MNLRVHNILDLSRVYEVDFTICTLISSMSKYSVMLDSFKSHGFVDRCEYLYVDNSSKNRLDPFQAIRNFSIIASGRYMIVCHDDVILVDDGREDLEREIHGLNTLCSPWSIAGNAGIDELGKAVKYITDPYGTVKDIELMPRCVRSLDENFLIFNRPFVFPNYKDSGFHHYATDLCLTSRILGASCYVVRFHLKHDSGGSLGLIFYNSRDAFERNWRARLPGRAIRSLCTTYILERSIVFRCLLRQCIETSYVARSLYVCFLSRLRRWQRVLFHRLIILLLFLQH